VGRRVIRRGSGKSEQGIDAADGRVLVEVDYFRPTEVDALVGDLSKALVKLGWRHRTCFDTLAKDMVEADLAAVVNEHRRHCDE
jgi:GDPmannose 4,6-dehydratase